MSVNVNKKMLSGILKSLGIDEKALQQGMMEFQKLGIQLQPVIQMAELYSGLYYNPETGKVELREVNDRANFYKAFEEILEKLDAIEKRLEEIEKVLNER